MTEISEQIAYAIWQGHTQDSKDIWDSTTGMEIHPVGRIIAVMQPRHSLWRYYIAPATWELA